jgi:hypothetical protein
VHRFLSLTGLSGSCSGPLADTRVQTNLHYEHDFVDLSVAHPYFHFHSLQALRSGQLPSDILVAEDSSAKTTDPMEEVRTLSSPLWHTVVGFSRGSVANSCFADVSQLGIMDLQSCFVFKVMISAWQGPCRLSSIVIWSAIAKG